MGYKLYQFKWQSGSSSNDYWEPCFIWGYFQFLQTWSVSATCWSCTVFITIYRCCFVFNVFIRQYKKTTQPFCISPSNTIFWQFCPTFILYKIHFYFYLYKESFIYTDQKETISFVPPSPPKYFLKIYHNKILKLLQSESVE